MNCSFVLSVRSIDLVGGAAAAEWRMSAASASAAPALSAAENAALTRSIDQALAFDRRNEAINSAKFSSVAQNHEWQQFRGMVAGAEFETGRFLGQSSRLDRQPIEESQRLAQFVDRFIEPRVVDRSKQTIGSCRSASHTSTARSYQTITIIVSANRASIWSRTEARFASIDGGFTAISVLAAT